VATLGPLGPGVMQVSYGAPQRCRGESTGLTPIVVAPDEKLTVGLKSWSRGQKSQRASVICCGGVSTIIGASDLDAGSFIGQGRSGNQRSCSLQSMRNGLTVMPSFGGIGAIESPVAMDQCGGLKGSSTPSSDDLRVDPLSGFLLTTFGDITNRHVDSQ